MQTACSAALHEDKFIQFNTRKLIALDDMVSHNWLRTRFVVVRINQLIQLFFGQQCFTGPDRIECSFFVFVCKHARNGSGSDSFGKRCKRTEHKFGPLIPA